jgi:hypothetical protein
VEGWHGPGIVVMACRAAGEEISLEGLVTLLFAVEVGSSRVAGSVGCRHSRETGAGLCVLSSR